MQVLVVGCGIVGATIAYELSQVPGLDITVVDRQAAPAANNQTTYQSGTGAALGLLMASISKKTKGRNLRMRFAGVDWYDRVIPEITARTGLHIPINRQGLLMLQFEDDRLEGWEKLIPIRQTQNRRLEIWDCAKLQQQAPHLSLNKVVAGIYSPDDRQIHPAILTQGIVKAAQQHGVDFQFSVEVTGVTQTSGQVTQVMTNQGPIDCEQLVIAAGLGAFPLTQSLNEPIELRPVLGQAVQLQLPQQLGIPEFQPVFTGRDIHIVPLGQVDGHWEYWVGATVEFPSDDDIAAAQAPTADPEMFATVMQGAFDLCPELDPAETIRHWSGIRPRPQGRPAPVIERLPGYDNVIIAAGHYRNGVLLAPATAIGVSTILRNGTLPETWI
ncbi:FAD-binding oxidoreductase [filamentous cyanobacterium LEGE 11480]|uniref:FAD-binding oxidoreductase n=1 Tax=Romeriopsis navalis LEGE 11480 TaxID=2777977 RepID=A0A928Z628_9CYAN|nr:FAD-dependent oxidoreductase [Romeriopsis navalis]MBE9032163.1 FAD-binding oxidoreductase [Romeriopsis navalis LEGE 11480]